jgi:hypothetical protein
VNSGSSALASLGGQSTQFSPLAADGDAPVLLVAAPFATAVLTLPAAVAAETAIPDDPPSDAPSPVPVASRYRSQCTADRRRR